MANYRIARSLIASVLLFGSAQEAGARVWCISPDGSGDAPTIQAAIDSSSAGDTVLVAPGTYKENLNFIGKDIVLASESGAAQTTIDGSGILESVIVFMNGESRNAVVSGFTIVGGLGHDISSGFGAGGGIYCNGSSPTIRNNILKNNGFSHALGGGFFLELPPASSPVVSPLIEQNVFQENQAYNGGAIALYGGEAVLTGNVFRNNHADYDGGGLLIWMLRGSVFIENNQFWENVALDHGGGIYAVNTSAADRVDILFNLFVRNEAHGQGALDTGSGGAILLAKFGGRVENNTMVGNQGFGENPCSGSGILLDRTPVGLSLRYNIIALGGRCGISCLPLFGPVETVSGPNILWGNTVEDIAYGPFDCPSSWAQYMMIVNPQFCAPEADNYSVSIDSPALTGPEPFGVWTQPGCGPGVKAFPITWGKLKATYH